QKPEPNMNCRQDLTCPSEALVQARSCIGQCGTPCRPALRSSRKSSWMLFGSRFPTGKTLIATQGFGNSWRVAVLD
ncbi:MAG TPA: hypothetical protein VI816_01470, partial [Candidatus Bathyarchaeia archaeon]|nr:hypothetical protein [Candidatus Bathyarchaeia archaeon]